MMSDDSELFAIDSVKPPKDGWQVTRDVADWMAGQDRTRALKHIDRMEALYKESKPNA